MTPYCSHGCGNPAQFFAKTGQGRCLSASSSCPAIRSKNAAKMKALHDSGKKTYTHNPKSAWSKGLTRESDSRVDRISNKLSETHRQRLIDQQNEIGRYRVYRLSCQWDRRVFQDLYKIAGHETFLIHKLYHRVENTKGCVRDHRLSIRDGFKLGVDPELMNHPANCRFLIHSDNARKSGRSEISVDELKLLIHNW